jgi:addiction module HigA family antidote
MTINQTHKPGWKPDYAVHPGELLRETLSERHLTQADLVRATGYSSKHVNLVIAGKNNITAEFALNLEEALGVTAEFWVSMQMHYDLYKLRAETDYPNGHRQADKEV